MKKLFDKIINFIYKTVDKIGENKFLTILIMFFLILSVLPLIVPGISIGHDIGFHLSRIGGIADGLRNGNFPVLIYPGYLSDYGYANGLFYPDLFLYIPALLHLLGLSTINCYKLLLFVITIATFFSMYIVVKKITRSNYVATIISILYLMSSYRITDMWIRSALGESFTFIFLPFVMLGLYGLLYDDVKDWKYLTIGLVGVVLSHLLSGIFCIIVVLLFAVLNLKKIFNEKDRLKYSLIAGFLAIGITSFFTLPLLEAMKSDSFIYQNYTSGLLTVERSVSPLFTIIEIPPRLLPWVPQGIGIVFIYLFIRFIRVKIDDKKLNHFKNICLISGIFFLFTSTSLFPWKIVGKVLGLIQFPWRFYILVTIFLLLGFAILINNAKLNFKSRINNILILCVFAGFTYCVGTMYNFRAGQVNDAYKYSITWGEYVPVDVDIKEYENRGNIVTSNNDINFAFSKKGTNIKVNYGNNIFTDTYLELPLMYYNGYVAISNAGDKLRIEKGNNGMIRVYLSDNAGSFKVYYGFTLVRVISYFVSIISLMSYIFLIFRKKKVV